jgi:class 3 adenylate cyclase/tetratricopeptide (TPR) repeat protein
LEPAHELRELEQAILREDAELEAPRAKRLVAPSQPLPPQPELPVTRAPTRQVRKTVTVLFCDLVGSTALGESTDPETLRELLSRYFARMKTIVERHGGAVEKFIGDAVMAVFGVPVVHEDDALRACRAALEMRANFPELDVEGRIGVTTGEVVTGTEERLATGTAVNIAARLQQVAPPGDVLIGELTLQLVGEVVEVEALEPLELKGTSQPVRAYRLLAMRRARASSPEAPFVGRRQELAAIQEVWQRTLSEQRCELLTIVGEAGIGKSRLAAEALNSVEARTVQGRCLPYGEGITYWPVIEVIKQLDARPSDATAAAAIRSLLDESEIGASAEEIAWSFRKLLEEAAPLIVVFDDIHWAEETFLDLLEHAALLSVGSPLLLVCMARPELTERRPHWPVTLRLEPFGADEVDELIGERVSDALRARIARVGGGNPLFLEEMVAMTEAGEDMAVPPTLQALLAARLDQLDSVERRVLELGAVEGEVFHRGAVQSLAPEEMQVTPQLGALVRKGFIRPEKSQLAGEDGFRFRHVLVRDAAYAGLPKATRGDLHRSFAAWIEQRGLIELEEILGYHLEQAHDYRLELRPTDDQAPELGARAALLLGRAGARALGRNDVDSALKLLRRAVRLYGQDVSAVAVRLDLSHALFLSGDFEPAADLANDVAERAAELGDRAGELRARLAAARIAAQVPAEEPEGPDPSVELLTLAEQALPVFAAAGDEVGLTDAWLATAWAHHIRCHWTKMLEAVDRATAHARAAGYARWERELPVWRATALFYGPTPVEEVLQWHTEEAPQHAIALHQRAVLEAMLCHFDAARELLDAADAAAAEGGEAVWRVIGGMTAWEVEMLAGDVRSAERIARGTSVLLEELGDSAFRSLVAGQLAASLYELGHLDEARTWTQSAKRLASRDDVASHMLWRQVRAKLLAREGRRKEAVELSTTAVALSRDTDMLNWQANAFRDMAGVYLINGLSEDGRECLEKALKLYSKKGNLAAAATTRFALAQLPLRAL